jgi:hypothetical protein
MVGNCITEFTDDDFMRIWKGLFYCMWMADKPLVQVLVTVEEGCSFHRRLFSVAFPYSRKAPFTFAMSVHPLSVHRYGGLAPDGFPSNLIFQTVIKSVNTIQILKWDKYTALCMY